MELINTLIKEGWLKTPEIIKAFRKIKRKDFLPQDIKDLANLNEALSIGWGQTISQPLVVAFMLEKLRPKQGENILDIGAGSGWTSALLAEIVGERGKVIAIERIPELKKFGEENVKNKNVQFICADGSKGYPDMASCPELVEGFDRILVSAAVQEEIPKDWREQVKIGGRIVTPVGSSIWTLIKKSETEFKEIEYPGFAFVPLVEN